ncbi:MAG: hypothetical protein ACK5HO_03825 [Pseudomonadota bacterium]
MAEFRISYYSQVAGHAVYAHTPSATWVMMDESPEQCHFCRWRVVHGI